LSKNNFVGTGAADGAPEPAILPAPGNQLGAAFIRNVKLVHFDFYYSVRAGIKSKLLPK
jgi:hypothetical protein